jgi:hypothetical protein
MTRLFAPHSTVMLGALLLMHCGGQSTDLFEGSGAAGGLPAQAGRGGGSGAGGGSAVGGAVTTGGSNATGGFGATGGAGGSATAGTSSSGGAGGSGATGGAGGSVSSGGSAGASGSGGDGGSGAATGGTAAGGNSGSGGAAGSGGVAGGSGGDGGLSGKGGKGSGGGGEDECDAIGRELASTLAEARACNLALSSRLSCTGEVVNECGCPVVVDQDDSEATRRYRMLMEQFNERCSVPCPAVVCRLPVSGRCNSEDNSVHGLCEPLFGGDR